MFQQIKSGFVRREIYYVKIREGYMRDLIFTDRAKSETGLWFDDIDERYGYLLHLHQIIIYRYVTDKEYYEKLKEKYDAKCLDIVLKRLVNENFTW
jgi:hypothetical protein